VEPAGKQEVIQLQPSLLDPRCQSLSGGGCYLELDRALRLVLHDDGARGNLFAVAHVADLQGNQVAAAQLAVDPDVEEGQLADPAFHLEANAQRPDVFQLERCLLSNDLALVPRRVVDRSACSFHDGLPSS
jgi:hypothetical protein